MEKVRIVDKLLCIFDLPDSLGKMLSTNGPTRIMLVYDKQKRERRFTVLSKNVPLHLARKIETWLEANAANAGMNCGMDLDETIGREPDASPESPWTAGEREKCRNAESQKKDPLCLHAQLRPVANG